jgi:5-methylthioribose kinase
MTTINTDTSLSELQILPFWEANEQVLAARIAGVGNMNVVLRITTNLRSVILKQSKAYVRKFPQIPAPIQRIAIEHDYFNLVNQNSVLRNFSPKILAFDPDDHLLLTEDLGEGIDCSKLYSKELQLEDSDFERLTDYLNELHGLSAPHFPSNLEMKKLNHEHIFEFPFLAENGFDLDSIQPGLQQLSLEYKNDNSLKSALKELGKRYLTLGDTLLQGDYYPGSWLKVNEGIKVIDPEFAFVGDKEFDLGVMLAHMDLAQQSDEKITTILKRYRFAISSDLLYKYKGVEIMRRLIGIAQLPIELSLIQKKTLLDSARILILA